MNLDEGQDVDDCDDDDDADSLVHLGLDQTGMF